MEKNKQEKKRIVYWKNSIKKIPPSKKYIICIVVAIILLFTLYLTVRSISGRSCKGLYENGYVYFNSDLNDFIISKDDTLISHAKKEIRILNVDYIIKTNRWKCILKLLQDNSDVKFIASNKVRKIPDNNDTEVSFQDDEPEDAKKKIYVTIQNEDNPSIALASYISFLQASFENNLCNEMEKILKMGELVSKLKESFVITGIDAISNADIIKFFESSGLKFPKNTKASPESLDKLFDKPIQKKSVERICNFIHDKEQFYKFYDEIFDNYYDIKEILKNKRFDSSKDVRVLVTTHEPQKTSFRVIAVFGKSHVSMGEILSKINDTLKN